MCMGNMTKIPELRSPTAWLKLKLPPSEVQVSENGGTGAIFCITVTVL